MDFDILDIDVFNTAISEDVTKNVCNGGFLDYEEDKDTEDNLNDNFFYIESLSELRKSLILLVKRITTEDGVEFWRIIAENEGYSKTMMATLALLIDGSKRKEVTAHSREASIISASVYLTLIRIPGHAHVQFFHPVIFQKSIDSLKNIVLIDNKVNQGRKARSSSSQSSQRSQSGSQRSQPRSRRKRSSQSQDGTFDESTDDIDLSDHELMKFKSHLLTTLQSLIAFLKFDPLKNHTDLSEAVIDLLANLTVVEPTSFTSAYDSGVIVQRISSVCHLAYLGILIICQRNEGMSVAMVKQAFLSLERNMLMYVGQKRDSVAAQNIPRETVMIRDQTLSFVLHVMTLGKDNVRQPLYRLVRSYILSTPDRSEYRIKVSQSVLTLMSKMSTPLYCDMCKWLFQLSKYKKASGRMMAVEILGQLLVSTNFRKVEDTAIDQEILHYSTRPVLLQALLLRCSDKLPTVMAKALSMLAGCLTCEDTVVSREIRGFITPHISRRLAIDHTNSNARLSSGSAAHLGSVVTGADGESVDTIQTASGSNFTRYTMGGDSQPPGSATAFYLTRGFDITLADSEGLVSLIKRRMLFNKAAVRKSALQALESIIMYNNCTNMSKELEVMKDHCRDAAVPIRKQAIQALSQLIQRYPTSNDVQVAWLTGVLPAYDDNESSVQEKCWEVVKSIILDNIKSRDDGEEAVLAWKLCSRMNDPSMHSLQHMLHTTCIQLHKRSNLNTNLVKILSQYITTTKSKEAWMLMSLICPITSTSDSSICDLVASQWLQCAASMQAADVTYVLTSVATLAAHISTEKQELLITDLLGRLRTYQVPPKYVKYMVVAVSQLIKGSAKEDVWVKQMAEEIETFISSLIYSENYDREDVNQLPSYLITLGEISLHNTNAISKKLIQFVQSIVLVPKVEEDKRKPGLLTDLSEGLLPSSIRRTAIHCLGQICLQHETEAKQTIPVLSRELEISSDPQIKRSIVIILCDLCKLYTNAVGPYLSSMSSSLRSAECDVRRSAFIGMTRLLQEDFLKWKGSLFYRFITCIVDEDPSIAELAKQTFIHELSKRQKALYSQHFVECVYHFNDFLEHKSYNKFAQTENERALFSLTGVTRAHKRHEIYNFMLEHMSDVHKFSVTQRLCQDIVSAAVEKELPINTTQGADVLVDALQILQSKNIKLSVTKTAPESLIDGSEEITPSQANTAKQTAVAVTKLVRKNFIETVIPDIISLKIQLESSHSPIIRHLMLFLIEITKDYKTELADILAGNQQLATELEFDIRKFEEMQAARAAEQRSMNHSVNHSTVIPSASQHGDMQQEDVKDKTLVEAVSTPARNVGAETPVIVAQITPAANPSQPVDCTPLQPPEPTTPGPRVISGTPAMPPPPLRSAMKKPAALATAHLIDSARKMVQEREKSGGTVRNMAKRVNFDEEDEDDMQEEAVAESIRLSNTPLRPIISAAVGARAISTPAGQLADLTFANANTSVVRSLSPILAFNNPIGQPVPRRPIRRSTRQANQSGSTPTVPAPVPASKRTSIQRLLPPPAADDKEKKTAAGSARSDDPLTAQWRVQSPLPKSKRKISRGPPPVDASPDQTPQHSEKINTDILTTIPVSGKTINKVQARRSGRKRKQK